MAAPEAAVLLAREGSRERRLRTPHGVLGMLAGRQLPPGKLWVEVRGSLDECRVWGTLVLVVVVVVVVPLPPALWVGEAGVDAAAPPRERVRARGTGEWES